MIVDIDKSSGFCFGVSNAVKTAENELNKNIKLFCLGDIVHNELEVNRLINKGLKIISYEEFRNLKNSSVLIRAHGEPPETYLIAKQNNIRLIDASCPIVLKLQLKIRKAYEEMQKIDGQIVIYGKHGHAEVIGLLGQTDNTAIVVESADDIEKIDFKRPIRLFSQTTKSIDGLAEINRIISERINQLNPMHSFNDFISNDSICRKVSNRSEDLKIFSNKYEVIIFVSGKNSSNGMFLYKICKSVNKNTYLVNGITEIEKYWFSNAENVGICGATSTPMWLMEEIAEYIRKI